MAAVFGQGICTRVPVQNTVLREYALVKGMDAEEYEEAMFLMLMRWPLLAAAVRTMDWEQGRLRVRRQRRQDHAVTMRVQNIVNGVPIYPDNRSRFVDGGPAGGYMVNMAVSLAIGDPLGVVLPISTGHLQAFPLVRTPASNLKKRKIDDLAATAVGSGRQLAMRPNGVVMFL
jgi:hypothetical protein